MGAWDIYGARINAKGGNRRSAMLQRERRVLSDKMPEMPSFHRVTIDGKEYGVSVIDSDNLNQKTLYTMPGQRLPHGGVVDWMDEHWLITEVDANNEIYSKGIMLQCNYLLRWVASDKTIVERWTIVEDGTKLERTGGTRWFGILETIYMNDSSLCWNTLRAILPKRSGEQPQTATA